MSVWQVRNALRSVFSDPRKLVPVVLLLIAFGFPILMFGMLRGTSSRLRAESETIRRQYVRRWNQERNRGASVRQLTPPFDPSRFMVRPELDGETFGAVVAVALILVGVGILNTGLGDRLLALKPSDVDYIFPAPISRRVVLAYMMPGLTIKALGVSLYLLFMISLLTQIYEPKMGVTGNTISPWWVNPLALFLSGGIYLHIAMFVSIRFQTRGLIQRAMWIGLVGFLAVFVTIASLDGIAAAEVLLRSPVLRWMFLPSTLASDSIVSAYSRLPAGSTIAWLALGYAGTLALIFSTNTNWYEQSIASTDKWNAWRQAAKTGWAGVMAARAANYNYKSERDYTVAPFGQYAGALFWAHLCAAAKKPLPNFGVPVLAGLAVGAVGGYTMRATHTLAADASGRGHVSSGVESLSYSIVFVLLFYCWQGFMTTSRLASEASIRRRELIAPLPIPGWKSVGAELGVPILAAGLCFVTAVIAFACFGQSNLAPIAFAVGLVLPLRMAGRVVLQHIVVIAYPDLADKVQRLISMAIGLVVGFPFLLAEAAVCVPALFFQSLWAALIPLALIQLPLGALFLFLAGKASERAIATGEPVRIWSLVRRTPTSVEALKR